MSDKRWYKLMELGRRLGCHQMPERSFFRDGYQFPVCARCTGVILSSILAIPVYLIIKIPKMLCVMMMGIMFGDWYVQHINIQESNNRRRYITGIIGGFGYMTVILSLYSYVYKKISVYISSKFRGDE
ncbi:MAG: DUF2085 domain-containing protein [Lachnospiraceae bacterium]|nr:DUF2085 domain-containing protein [Lachnospiraceae bacterium]